MIKKWILVFSLGFAFTTTTLGDDEHIPYLCRKKCFEQCKLNHQAVKNCQFSNFTSVSFNISCECRSLEKGEVLPAYFHDTRLIKTTAF
jgi:hypothetical protein